MNCSDFNNRFYNFCFSSLLKLKFHSCRITLKNDIIFVMKYGFDNDKYLKIQSEHIKERIQKFGDKLYLEFGGKLFDDFHASRVLPGFQPDSKLKMLMQLSDCAEIVIVISAVDIEKNKAEENSFYSFVKEDNL